MSDLMTLEQAAQKVPGGAVSSVTVWRWATSGMRSRSGQLVKLRTAAAGKRMLVSEAWLREFFEALGGQEHPASTPESPTCHCQQ